MFRHLAYEECEFFHTLDPILDLANGAHIVNNPNAVPLCKTLKKLTSLFKQSHIFYDTKVDVEGETKFNVFQVDRNYLVAFSL